MALICIIVFLQSFKKNSGTNALTVYLYMCSWGTSCGLLPSMMCTWCRTILWCIGRPYSAKEKKCSMWQAQIRWSTTERCDSPLSSEFRSISDPLCDHTVQDMQGGRPLSRGRSAPWRWKTTSAVPSSKISIIICAYLFMIFVCPCKTYAVRPRLDPNPR